MFYNTTNQKRLSMKINSEVQNGLKRFLEIFKVRQNEFAEKINVSPPVVSVFLNKDKAGLHINTLINTVSYFGNLIQNNSSDVEKKQRDEAKQIYSELTRLVSEFENRKKKKEIDKVALKIINTSKVTSFCHKNDISINTFIDISLENMEQLFLSNKLIPFKKLPEKIHGTYTSILFRVSNYKLAIDCGFKKLLEDLAKRDKIIFLTKNTDHDPSLFKELKLQNISWVDALARDEKDYICLDLFNEQVNSSQFPVGYEIFLEQSMFKEIKTLPESIESYKILAQKLEKQSEKIDKNTMVNISKVLIQKWNQEKEKKQKVARSKSNDLRVDEPKDLTITIPIHFHEINQDLYQIELILSKQIDSEIIEFHLNGLRRSGKNIGNKAFKMIKATVSVASQNDALKNRLEDNVIEIEPDEKNCVIEISGIASDDINYEFEFKSGINLMKAVDSNGIIHYTISNNSY